MKLVEVEWSDSCGRPAIWEERDGLTAMKPTKCRTVGYLLEDTRRYVIVAQSLSRVEVGRRFCIPRGCIRRMRRLR